MHIFRELNALAYREFPKGFAKWKPGNGLKSGIVPSGVTSGSFVRSADEVALKFRGVGGSSYVVGEPGGDLMWAMKQGSAGARDPRGEDAGAVWSFGVDSISLAVGKYINLSNGGTILQRV